MSRPLRTWIVALWALGPCRALSAALIVQVFSFDAGPLVVPDGDPTGTSDTRMVSLDHWILEEVRVQLTIEGPGGAGFNGDLYATLTHGSGYAVLLNRVGRTATAPLGYSDSGLDQVTFGDTAVNGDVHLYRLVATGHPSLALSGPLTGPWQPDGRASDPDTVLGGDPRTAMLSGFQGQDPNGAWTLFVADLSSGGQSQVTGWGLELQVTAVPEPVGTTLAVALACVGLACARRFRRSH